MCLAKRVVGKANQQKHQEPAATGGNVPGEAGGPLHGHSHGHGHGDHAGVVAPPSRGAWRRFPSPIRFPTCPEETGAKNNTLFLFQSELIPLAFAKAVKGPTQLLFLVKPC